MASACPCTTLRKATIIFATVDSVLYGFCFVISVLTLVGFSTLSPDNSEHQITQDQKNWLSIAFPIAIPFLFFGVVFSCYLRRSAKNESYTGCKRWIMVALVLVVLDVVCWAILIAQETFNLTQIGFGVSGILYRIYVIFVVYSFAKELKLQPTTSPNCA